MILFACIGIILIVAYLLSMEGIWGAASTLLCVVISGLLAMNYFEAAALYLSFFVPAVAEYADLVCLVGLFAGFTFGLRTLTEYLAPTDIRVPDLLDLIGKWGFGVATGYVTMAFLLTALHTAPLPRNVFDFQPELPVFFGIAPDRQWLAFTQYVSENSLANRIIYNQELRRNEPNIFDGKVQKVGDSPNTVWSSFPIRYAMRRSMIERGEFVGGTAVAKPPQPVIPAGGNRGGPAPVGGF